MANYLSNELAGTTTGLTTAPAAGYKPRASVYGGMLKRYRATVALAGQLVGDTIQLCNLPPGATFAFGVFNASTPISSALAVGTAATAGKYRASGPVSGTDTPTIFGTAAQAGAPDPALSAEETVFLSIGSVALPSSGTLVVDLYVSQVN
jgi:hypothetical protein